MLRFMIDHRPQNIRLILLKFNLIHNSMMEIDFAHKYNHNYELEPDTYYIKLLDILKQMDEVIQNHEELSLHLVLNPYPSYSRVLVFISQLGSDEDLTSSCINHEEISKIHTFTRTEAKRILQQQHGSLVIDKQNINTNLKQEYGLEVANDELEMLFKELGKFRREIKPSTYTHLNKSTYYLGNQLSKPILLDQMDSVLCVGSDQLILPLLHHNQLEHSVIITRVPDFWESYSKKTRIPILKLLEFEQGEFSLNLLDLCRRNPAFTKRVFTLFDLFSNSNYQDVNRMVDITNKIRDDPSLSEQTLSFKEIFDVDAQNHELWQDTDLRPFSSIKSFVENSFGEIYNKSYFQKNIGSLERITIIDTSELSQKDHILLALTFLAMQQTGLYDGWLVLSEIDQLLEDKSYRSSFEKIWEQVSPQRLILHTRQIEKYKSWHSLFQWTLINDIHKLNNSALWRYGLEGYSGMVLVSSFGERIPFVPTSNLPSRFEEISLDVEEIIDEEIEEQIEIEIDDEEEEISGINELQGYLIGAVMSCLSKADRFNEMRVHDVFIKQEMEEAISTMIEKEMIIRKENDLILLTKYKTSIINLRNSIEIQEIDGTIAQVLDDVRDQFFDADIATQKSLLKKLVGLCQDLWNKDDHFEFAYHLSIGLYREILTYEEKREHLYILILADILNYIYLTDEEINMEEQIQSEDWAEDTESEETDELQPMEQEIKSSVLDTKVEIIDHSKPMDLIPVFDTDDAHGWIPDGDYKDLSFTLDPDLFFVTYCIVSKSTNHVLDYSSISALLENCPIEHDLDVESMLVAGLMRKRKAGYQFILSSTYKQRLIKETVDINKVKLQNIQLIRDLMMDGQWQELVKSKLTSNSTHVGYAYLQLLWNITHSYPQFSDINGVLMCFVNLGRISEKQFILLEKTIQTMRDLQSHSNSEITNNANNVSVEDLEKIEQKKLDLVAKIPTPPAFASAKPVIKSLEEYMEEEIIVEDIPDFSLSEEQIREVSTLPRDVSPKEYLLSILQILHRFILKEETGLSLELLITKFSQAAEDSKVAITPLINNITEMEVLYQDSDEEIKSQVMKMYTDRILEFLPQLIITSEFIKALNAKN
ncbi:MAG: hypothetical protein INQ03_09065 [Candidatus Heimdallarchaeota archaeon]|nr:hypothetical protein [Candidatus Heimdallarchaeota archaeon]